MNNKGMGAHKAVILAGGKGTRLYPITKQIPKPLLPIGKRPILNHLVDLFRAHGVTDIAVLVNKEFHEDFVWWLKRHYPSANIQLFAEEEHLGTFGGLALVKEWLAGSHFFLTNGDELKELNLEDMARFHEERGGLGTIALAQVPNPKEYGVAVIEGDMIEQFLEKPENPPTDYISSGLYLLSPEIFSYHPGAVFSMIEKELFPILAKEKKLSGFKGVSRWTDCGTWERYEKALKEWVLP